MEIHQLESWFYIIAIWANIAIAIGTLGLAIGVPLSIAFAGREERYSFYATLDKTYFEIQKLIIEHPHLANPDPAGKTPEQLVEYDSFAFNVWNFVEAIVDYSGKNRFLTDTWHCALRHEITLHRAWFQKPENRKMFKPQLVRCILRREYVSKEPSSAAQRLLLMSSPTMLFRSIKRIPKRAGKSFRRIWRKFLVRYRYRRRLIRRH
jgi:hypothetical protein